MKRLAPTSVALSLAVAGIAAGLSGCDDRSTSDKGVIEKIDAGIAKLSSVDGLAPSENLTAAKSEFSAAAGSTGAGPAYSAVAAASLASLDQQVGTAGIDKLTSLEMNVRSTLTQLRALAEQVSLSNQYAVGYSQSDPKAAVGTLAGHISSMQGNAQALTWGPTEQTQLPTLAAVKQDMSRLQGEIDQRQQQLQDLKKQRSEALALSDQKLKQADSQKGDAAVKTFSEGSDARRKADDLAINIDLVQSQLSRLQAELAMQQGQEAALSHGITDLQEQGKLIETAWGELQKHAVAQSGIASSIVNGDDKSEVSIKSLSQQLSKELDEVKQQRSAILDQYTEAAKYFATARDDANKFSQSIQQNLNGVSKEVANYRALRETVHPQRYALPLGQVQRDSGAVLLTEAALLGEVESAKSAVQSILESAKVQLPAEFSAIDTSGSKALLDEAETQLTDATNTLTNVESGDSPDAIKKAAKIGRLIAMQNQLTLYSLKEAAGDAAAKQQAAQLKTDAEQLKSEIVAMNLPLPALPGDLGTPPAPATQPAGDAPAPQ
ncbi:MAG: hypothetical protein ACTHLZ_10455 [Tepidisphaeraceae bacterium]